MVVVALEQRWLFAAGHMPMNVDVAGVVREAYRSDEHVRGGDFAVTVAVPFANAAATLPEAIRSLAEQRAAPAFELLLVSNGTTDNSVEVALQAGQGLPIRVLKCDSVGYDSNARNVSMIEAAAEKLLFMDADDLAGPEYVAKMAAALDRAPLVTGVWSLHRLNVATFPDVADIVPIAPDSWPFRDQGWPYAPTGTLGMTKALIKAVGGFRQDLGVACNNEWCYRAFSKGFDIVPVLDAVQHYRMRRTAREMFFQRYNYGIYEVAATKASIPLGFPKRPLISAAGLGNYLRIGRQMLRPGPHGTGTKSPDN